jgi:competence protein ComEC
MRFVIWVLLAVAVLARFFLTLPKYSDGQKVRIIEKVTGEPIRYSYNQSFNLLGLRVYLPKYPEVSYGDEVVVEGTIEGRTLKDAKLVEIRPGKGFLFELRKKLVGFYQSSLPQPYSGLIAGVVLGSKSGLSESFWENLKTTSTAHVVVASGMNVSLVAGFLVGITSVFLPRRRAIPLAIGGVWIYSFLSGFDAPIIRAAIMGSIAFLAQAAGRLSSAWKGLFLSALIMLLVWPAWLTDLGFILSFVATASILLFEARINKFLSFVPNILKQDLSVTLAAQIGVAPIIFATFGQFNLLSPVINVLVLWTVAPITVIAGVSGIVGLIIPKLGSLMLYLCYPLAFWFVKVIEIFS